MPHHIKKLSAASIVAGALMLTAGLSGCHRTESTASLIAEAKQYQQKGDFKAAIIQLKNAVTNSPDDVELRYLLATVYNESGDPVSAEKEVRKAISLGMSSDRTMPVLGTALRAQGQFKKLLEETEAATAKGAPALLTLRGDAYLALNQPAKAKDAYEHALKAKPDDAEALLGLARFAMLEKDPDGAVRLTDDAVTKNPKNTDALMFKATLLRAQQKPELALAAYDQVLALQPNHRSAHIEKANIAISTGKLDAAKVELDAARKLTPNNLNLLYTEALLEFSLEKYPAAKDLLQKILRAAPEHLPSMLLAGSVELRLGSFQQAQQHLKKYLVALPQNLFARKLLVTALLKDSKSSEAIATLAPALKDSTDDVQLLGLAGEAYMQAGEFSKASGYLAKASELAPKSANIRTSLAVSKLVQGDAASAVGDLEMATALDPKSEKAGVALVQTEMSLKHYDKALAAVQAMEKQQPDSAAVHNLKGRVFLSKNDRTSARASFEKALALQPAFFPAVANLGQLDLQEKKADLAQKRFEAYLEKNKKHIGAMTALAQIATAQGHSEAATTWLEKASNENPEAIAPAIELGSHYLRIKQQQKALTLARKFQAANPANAELLNLMGQAQLANNDQAGALDAYSKLVNVLPKSALAQVRLAAVHMMMKNETAAAEHLKRAVALDPNFVQARVAQVELAMSKGNPDEALALARQIQKKNDKVAVGYLLEGDIYISQKKPALALPAFEKAFAIVKTPQMLLKIAEVMKLTGKAKEAEARLAQWQKEHPAEPTMAMYMAETALANKQYKIAIEHLQAILKQAPKNPIALNNLAWAYQQEKDPRALDTAEQAMQAAGDSPAVMDTLGWLLVEQGNFARGVPLLQKAVALAPQTADIRYHLAYGLNKSGDKVNARKELERALASSKNFAQIEEARALLKQL
jgi:putative PEP-CTERM system TPR-repeat lipoprotein